MTTSHFLTYMCISIKRQTNLRINDLKKNLIPPSLTPTTPTLVYMYMYLSIKPKRENAHFKTTILFRYRMLLQDTSIIASKHFLSFLNFISVGHMKYYELFSKYKIIRFVALINKFLLK